MPELTKPNLLTVSEACGALRVSRWMFYRLLQQRRIHTIKLGRRRLVSAQELSRLVAELEQEEWPR